MVGIDALESPKASRATWELLVACSVCRLGGLAAPSNKTMRWRANNETRKRIAVRRAAQAIVDRQIRELRHKLQCARHETCDLRDRLDVLETRIAQNP